MADASAPLTLEVATPLGMALDVTAENIQVPSVAGEFGVLPGHLPLLAAIKPGILRYQSGGETRQAAIGAGYVEADATKVRLITEFFTLPSEVDVAEAQSDLVAAEKRLKAADGPVDALEHREAQGDLDWALARLELAG